MKTDTQRKEKTGQFYPCSKEKKAKSKSELKVRL